MTITNVAIVGTGFMSWVHTEALRRIDLPIAGILGSSKEKGASAASSLGIDRYFESYDEILTDPDVHSVHICTPNNLHFEMAKSALLAGKHVLCEKPLAMTSAESYELLEIAAAHPQLAAAVNYNIRYYPLCMEAREFTQAQESGDFIHATGSYTQDWLSTPNDYNWRVLADKGGALRAVADIGTHWLDLIQFISGTQIQAVCADLNTVHPFRSRPIEEIDTFTGPQNPSQDRETVDITTEDYGAILLRFEGGARGCLHVSQVVPGHKNCLRFEIVSSKQSLAWNSEQPNELHIGKRSEANQILMRDPALLTDFAHSFTSYPGGHNEGYPDSFKQCFRDFYKYIENANWNETPTFPRFTDGHHEVQLCEAILKSHNEQRWIAIQETERCN